MSGLLGWDQAATVWINQHHSLWLDILLMPVAWLGEAGLWAVLFLLAMLIWGGRRERLLTLILAGGLLATELLLMPWFRELWPRPRPYLYLPEIRQMGVPWSSPSFPSAHMHLWVQATLLYGLAYRRALGPLVALTLLTAYSRPYAGMHHVLDVAAGMGLGAVMGLLEVLVAKQAGLLGGRGRPERPSQG